MSDVVIRTEGLGKRYRIGVRPGRVQRALRDSIAEAVGGAFHRAGRALRRSESPRSARAPDHFWALQDLSLTIRRGEVVGVIGRNGAGKSTLLKILSRITKPTSGYVDLQGRVASLLEVGTGFHQDLSGRDNIYLNGAILGMRFAEIKRRFDEIVDFSGVATFIDTPVKHYSSGMYVRLAFAVAAHLEPEILLVDEVLAVGDAEFQKRCLGKMQSVVKEGRTVLFVSHNLAAVKSLCSRAVLLDAGRLSLEGRTDAVVDAYLTTVTSGSASATGRISETTPRVGSGDARFRAVELLDPAGRPAAELYLGQAMRVALTLEVSTLIPDAVVEVGISALDGTRITTSFTVDGERPALKLPPGCYRFCLDLTPFLLPRTYAIDVAVHHANHGVTIDAVDRVWDFTILNVAEAGGDSYFTGEIRGFVRPPARWHEAEPVERLQ